MIHLNYDGKQKNGVIFNDKYTKGAMYLGAEFKPNTTFSYDSMQYSEVFEGLNYVELDGIKRVMTIDEESEVKALATNWIQPLGQEGNPTLEQAKVFKHNYIQSSFDNEVKTLSDAQPHEMASWKKQEEQARAWNVDNAVSTPIIDAILSTRTLGDTKQQFVDLIIANADAYEAAYGALLGKFQNLSKATSNATTVSEVEAIVW